MTFELSWLIMFKQNCYCVVTGASRGLGREIAVQLSREWTKSGVESDVVLTARNIETLEATKALISSEAPGVRVHVVPGDLGDTGSLPDLCTRLLAPLDPSRKQCGVLVHNAATMNEFVPFLEQTDPRKIQAYFDTNLTSMIVLSTRFLSAFPPNSGQQHYVVDITAFMASSNWFSLYATAKAARSGFMRALLDEMPQVRQLSYSPGPCNTDMLREIPANMYSIVGQPIRLLSAQESIEKMVGVLREDQFQNGTTVDYFGRV